MKLYKVPIYWQMSAYVDVEADSPEDAIEKARLKYGNPTEPLPEDGEYIDDSFEVEENADCVYEV